MPSNSGMYSLTIPTMHANVMIYNCENKHDYYGKKRPLYTAIFFTLSSLTLCDFGLVIGRSILLYEVIDNIMCACMHVNRIYTYLFLLARYRMPVMHGMLALYICIIDNFILSQMMMTNTYPMRCKSLTPC